MCVHSDPELDIGCKFTRTCTVGSVWEFLTCGKQVCYTSGLLIHVVVDYLHVHVHHVHTSD